MIVLNNLKLHKLTIFSKLVVILTQIVIKYQKYKHLYSIGIKKKHIFYRNN